ncbi:MAG: hypothetical protein QXR45_07670 [Candidatus Bathyarchaeia archaeon]
MNLTENSSTIMKIKWAVAAENYTEAADIYIEFLQGIEYYVLFILGS